VGGQAFRLDDYLVAVLVGEAMDLVFDRWAIARADTLDDAGIHRRAIQVGGDDLVGARIGVGDPAADLPRMLLAIAEEGHHRQRVIPRLLDHLREIHRTTVATWWGAGLEASASQWLLAQSLCQRDRGRIAGTTAGVILQADVDKSAEEGTCGQYH